MRPYGNFAIDCDNSIYYAYTMLDEENCTRYFSFDLPKMTDGVYDKILGVKRVVLQKDDIKDFFDCPYHRFIQGSCFRDGILYSLEGFTHSCDQNPPAVRRIDIKAKKQMDIHRFADYGYPIETELIAFDHDVCYYANGHGYLFELTF